MIIPRITTTTKSATLGFLEAETRHHHFFRLKPNKIKLQAMGSSRYQIVLERPKQSEQGSRKPEVVAPIKIRFCYRHVPRTSCFFGLHPIFSKIEMLNFEAVKTSNALLRVLTACTHTIGACSTGTR